MKSATGRRALLGGLAFALLAASANAEPAGPVGSASLELMVLHATQGEGPAQIDPQVGNLSQLRRPPFNSYNRYKLMSRDTTPVSRGGVTTRTLPNGRTLKIELAETLADKRARLVASITQPDGKNYLKVLEITARANEPIFVAGQPYAGGILVLGITLR